MKKILLLLMLLSTMTLNAQDVIVMKDGSTIISKVIEIGTSEIKYKKYSNLDGPLYTVLLSDVQNINFENGEKEIISKETVIEEPKQSSKHDVVLRYGTEIPVQVLSPIKARDVKNGQEISFRTVSDVIIDGVKIIPASTPVKGIVYEAKRSSAFGTKGKLGIYLNHLTLLDGTRIPVKGDIYVTGKSRAVLSVLLFLFVTWPACFICGTKAQLITGYETMARIGATVNFPPDGQPYIVGNNKKQLERIDLSSITVPKLPCKATITDINGNRDRVQIEKVSSKKNLVKFRLLDENEKATGDLYFYQVRDIHSIDFDEK